LLGVRRRSGARRKAGRVRARRHRPGHVRLALRRLRAARAPWPWREQAAPGRRHGAPRPRARAQLPPRDARRARALRALRLHAARRARALAGDPPPVPPRALSLSYEGSGAGGSGRLADHAITLVLRRHRDEVPQALAEFVGPVPRALDPADPDAPVARGEPLEACPRARRRPQRGAHVGPHAERPRLQLVAERALSRLRHPTGGDEAERPLAIHRRQLAVRTPRREALRVAVLAERLVDAVDPAEAERLVDRVVVGDPRLAARLLRIDEPDLLLTLGVAGEPAPPLGAVANVESRPDLHRMPLTLRSGEVSAAPDARRRG